jgi:site-specific recombinase XerD
MTVQHASLADLVTAFFTRHLAAECGASGHTITSYRDTFRLLLRHAADRAHRAVARLTIEDFGPDEILAFLDFLEEKRGNVARTRNARLAAIHSFFAYVVAQDPTLAAQAQRILAIPFKKTPRKLLGHLDKEEMRAILSQPDRKTPMGRRDYLALSLLYDSGARVQELVDLRPADFRLDRVPLVTITGKGRKQRIVPLLPVTAKLVREHLVETARPIAGAEPLLRNRAGQPMTRSGVTFLVDKYRRRAAAEFPSLQRTGISPHTLRHTKAMHLLQSGIHPVTIKDILGHADLKTLEVYVQADLEMKRKAIEGTPSPTSNGPRRRRRPLDLLAWLESL